MIDRLADLRKEANLEPIAIEKKYDHGLSHEKAFNSSGKQLSIC